MAKERSDKGKKRAAYKTRTKTTQPSKVTVTQLIAFFNNKKVNPEKYPSAMKHLSPEDKAKVIAGCNNSDNKKS